MSRTPKSVLPRMWPAWLLVFAALALAIVAWGHRTSKLDDSATAVGIASVPEAPAERILRDPVASAVMPVPEATPMDQIRAASARRGAKAASRLQYWEDGFAAQPIDPAWASQQKKSILALFDSEEFVSAGSKPRDLEIDCRKSVCRLTAAFDSVSSGQDWIELVSLHSGGKFTGGATNLQQNPDGGAKVKIYVQPQG